MAKTKLILRWHTTPKAPVIVVEDEEEMASRATPEEGEIVDKGEIVAEKEPEEDSNLCAIHAKRVTIMPKDIQLARQIKGECT